MIVADDYRGRLVIEVDGYEGTVRLREDGLPEALVRRTGTVTNPRIPIGTRRHESLTMTVGGREADLELERGGLTRESRRVAVTVDGERYEMVPDAEDRNSFVRRDAAGRPVPLGAFFFIDGACSVAWEDEPGATATAVGYALAAAFGVGAESPWQLLMAPFLGW